VKIGDYFLTLMESVAWYF